MEHDIARGGVRDLVALTKPTITVTTLVTCAGGLLVAGVPVPLGVALAALVGTGLVVASANAFNMVLERHGDAHMARTRTRPLPAGRLSGRVATVEAALLGAAGFALMYGVANALTAWLALASLVTYAFVYTPLKRRTPWALIIGAVPGAMPPLLGWTAATGVLATPGIAIFLLLFVWQLPHFLAIALRCREDYARAGIQAVSVVYGDRATRRQAVTFSLLLVPTSLLLPMLGRAGWAYVVAAVMLGTWMSAVGVRGLVTADPAPWDRKLFLLSLVYLPVVICALAVDVVLL